MRISRTALWRSALAALLGLRLRIERGSLLLYAAAALWLAALCAWLWLLPAMRIEEQQVALQLAQARARSATRIAAGPGPAITNTQLADFHAALGDGRYAEQQVRTLFALAARNGLQLAQAEYKLMPEREGKFLRYQVSLPVNGRYPAIYRFVEQTLLAIPFAALAELRFQRPAIASHELEARLQFNLYLELPEARPAEGAFE